MRLPQCEPTPSRATKRLLLKSQGEQNFPLSIVREVGADLDLRTLSHKIVIEWWESVARFQGNISFAVLVIRP